MAEGKPGEELVRAELGKQEVWPTTIRGGVVDLCARHKAMTESSASISNQIAAETGLPQDDPESFGPKEGTCAECKRRATPAAVYQMLKLHHLPTGYERQQKDRAPTKNRWPNQNTTKPFQPLKPTLSAVQAVSSDELRPLPEKLYHVTTARDAVLEHGLKTRQELGQQYGHGLGGGRDDTISLTAHRPTADHLLHSLHEYHDVLNGKITPDDLIDKAERGVGAKEPFRDLVTGGNDYYERAKALEGDRTTDHGVHVLGEQPEGWEPDGESVGSHKDSGKPVHLNWTRPVTDRERTHARSELYKSFSWGRQFAGGHMNPLFVANDPVEFAKKDPKQFALLHVRSRNGAQGIRMNDRSEGTDAGEWRALSGGDLDVTHYEGREDIPHRIAVWEAGLKTIAKTYTWKGQTYGPNGGYVDKEYSVEGPLYHGSRSKRLNPGDLITPGRKTNPWGDEGPKSKYVHFTDDHKTARDYADQAGGHVYEVEPTGEFSMGYHGNEYKSIEPLRVIRRVDSEKTAGWNDKDPVYLRFGHWPENERSSNGITGFPEEGVSVYDLDHRGEPKDPDPGFSRWHEHDSHCEPDCDLDQWNDEYGNDAGAEMNDRVHRAERARRNGEDRPSEVGHLVKGTMVGVGHDGEPLLNDVRRVGDWIDHRHLFIPGAKRHRLARDPDDDDYEPPEEHSTRTAALSEEQKAKIMRIREQRKQEAERRRAQPAPSDGVIYQTKQPDLSRFFTPIPEEELAAQRKAREPKPERLDDKTYSIDAVSRHYGWEGFDPFEIEHLVHRPERATFTKEDVPVHTLRAQDIHGALIKPPSYRDLAGQGEDEQQRLHGLEQGREEDGLPPIVVVRHGKHHIIVDGHHRAAIAAERGDTHIPAFVTERTILPKESAKTSTNDAEGPYYHGTRVDLKPGDYIHPGHPTNFPDLFGDTATDEVGEPVVYATRSREGAERFAEMARGSGRPRVYHVEPEYPEDLEDDPEEVANGPGNSVAPGSVRSRFPLRVVREAMKGGSRRTAALFNPVDKDHPDEWFHGSPHEFGEMHDPMETHPLAYEYRPEDSTHWNTVLGNHFTSDHDLAHEFSGGQHREIDDYDDPEPGGPLHHVIHARLHLKNPKHYDSEFDMDQEVYEHERAQGNHIDNYLSGDKEDDEDDYPLAHHYAGDSETHYRRDQADHGVYADNRMNFRSTAVGWLNAHPDKIDIAARFKKRLQQQGHDGIVYGNEFEKSAKGKRATSAIAFEPHQIEITQHHYGKSNRCLTPEDLKREPGPGQEQIPGTEHIHRVTGALHDNGTGRLSAPLPGEVWKDWFERLFRQRMASREEPWKDLFPTAYGPEGTKPEYPGNGVKQYRHSKDMPVPLYHGTSVKFELGDLIEPGHPGNFVRRMKHVYATEDPEEARRYGWYGIGSDWDKTKGNEQERHPRVYEVRPTGPYGHRSDAKGRNWASEDPWEVVREVWHHEPNQPKEGKAMRREAHDSGDGQRIFHCPFCGAGQVIARSDGTVECEFCHQAFTVQVQPQFSTFPQTDPVTGLPVQIPGMPGQIDAPGTPPGAPGASVPPGADDGSDNPFGGDSDDDSDAQDPSDGSTEDSTDNGDDDKPDFLKSKSSLYLTAAGDLLPEGAYVRHLALRYAPDPDKMSGLLRSGK